MMVGIVAGADRVDVVLLHQQDVVHHVLEGHRTAVVDVRLMTVHALHLDRLAVDEHHAVDNLLLLHAETLRPNVLARGDDERVEIRLFGAPELHALELGLRGHRLARDGERTELGDLLPPVEDLGLWRLDRSVGRKRQRNRRVLVLPVEHRRDREIADAALRTRPERHVTEDAREAEHVLVLEIAAVAPAEDLDREEVVALLEVRRDVELRRKLGVFGIADLLSVRPHVVGGIDAVEAQDDLAALPGLGHGEGRTVGGDGIVVRTSRITVDDRRETAVLRIREVLMRIPDIGVARNAVAAHLDTARHVDRVPVGIVEIGLEEVRRTPRGIADPLDLPIAVQGLLVRRHGFEVIRQRRRRIGQRNRIRRSRHAVDGIDRRILPRQGERQQGSKNVAHGICLLFLQ